LGYAVRLRLTGTWDFADRADKADFCGLTATFDYFFYCSNTIFFITAEGGKLKKWPSGHKNPLYPLDPQKPKYP